MSRAERRMMEKSARRGTARQPRVVPLPKMLDEFCIFDIPQSIVDKLKSGSIDAHQGVPVFRDLNGQYCEVAPALMGWIFTWQKISEGMNMGLSFEYLNILYKRLGNSVPITHDILAKVEKEIDACRIAFRANDRSQITSIAKTANIQILLKTDNL